MQNALELIERSEAAATVLDPVRMQILARLREPASAVAVARQLGLPRQKVAYHIRELEKQGVLRHLEDKRKGNCVERVVQASARQYVIAPQALGPLGVDPVEVEDRFSSAYTAALAARTLRELAALRRRADAAGKKLATLTLDTELRFGSAAAQSAFAEELIQIVQRLAAKYHDAASPRGRTYRLLVTSYVSPIQKRSQSGSAPHPDPLPGGEGEE